MKSWPAWVGSVSPGMCTMVTVAQHHKRVDCIYRSGSTVMSAVPCVERYGGIWLPNSLSHAATAPIHIHACISACNCMGLGHLHASVAAEHPVPVRICICARVCCFAVTNVALQVSCGNWPIWGMNNAIRFSESLCAPYAD